MLCLELNESDEGDEGNMRNLTKTYLATTLFMLPFLAWAQGTLTDNRRISSEVLGYDLQYRVYIPQQSSADTAMPVIYITDGQWYISEGELPQLLDREIAVGRIDPVIAVFVDSRNPDDLQQNRRNQQFFCNPAYVGFFTQELVPYIDQNYSSRAERDARVILGLSFGGRNSGCFGLMAHETFGGIAMQSPANTPMVEDLRYQFMVENPKPLKIFLSVGTIDDNTQAGQQLKETLEFLEYEMTYREVDAGHNWNNWKPLLDDVLHTFF